MNTILAYITFRRTIANTVIVALFWVWAIGGFLVFALGSVGVVFGTVGLLRIGPLQPDGRSAIIAISCLQIFGMAIGFIINVMVARITCEFLVYLFRFFEDVKSISDSHSQVARYTVLLIQQNGMPSANSHFN